MPKAATLQESPALPTTRQQALNAMVLLYDALPTDREKGCAMELFVQFAFRAWGWNVEKFIKQFNAAQNGTPT
jgi:hypothetical protein